MIGWVYLFAEQQKFSLDSLLRAQHYYFKMFCWFDWFRICAQISILRISGQILLSVLPYQQPRLHSRPNTEKMGFWEVLRVALCARVSEKHFRGTGVQRRIKNDRTVSENSRSWRDAWLARTVALSRAVHSDVQAAEQVSGAVVWNSVRILYFVFNFVSCLSIVVFSSLNYISCMTFHMWLCLGTCPWSCPGDCTSWMIEIKHLFFSLNWN